MRFLHRRLLMGVLAVARHPVRTLALAGLLLAIAGALAFSRLTISTDQNELFSAKVPFFADYLDFNAKFPETEAVYLVIEPRDPSAHPATDRWAAAADAVTQAERGLPDVAHAQSGVPLAEVGQMGLLLDNPADLPGRLADLNRLAPLAQLWSGDSGAMRILGSSPIERFLSAAGASADDESASFAAALAGSWKKAVADSSLPMRPGSGVVDLSRLDANDPRDLGYNYVPDATDPSRWRLLVQVYPTTTFNSLTAVTRTVDDIRDAADKAAAAFPEFKVGITGRPALDADEMRTTDEDSRKAEAVALTAVFVGMVVMFRSIRLALAAEFALCVGIGWTFGWATISVGRLNLLSLVFLIALIGIGMDYLVQVVTRYLQEARRYPRPEAIWVRVFAHVGLPINTACAGAAGAFLVSTLTDFRGAAELGMIAGGGLLLCLAAGYTVLPAVLTLWPPTLTPQPGSARYVPHRHRGSVRLLLPLVWMAGLLAVARFAPRAGFDPGLIDLQSPNLPSVKLVRTLQTWSAVVLSRDLNQLRAVRDRVAGLSVVDSTDSFLNAEDNWHWLADHAGASVTVTAPSPLAASDLPRLAGKARNLADVFDPPAATAPASAVRRAAAAALRDWAGQLEPLTGDAGDAAARRLSTWQGVFATELSDLLGQAHPAPPDLAALPAEIREHWHSLDGYYALYILPKDDLWNPENLALARFVTQVDTAVAALPGAPHVTGIAPDIYLTTGAIRVAFVHATEYALTLVFLLVLLDFRRLGPTLAAISVLGLGLPMLVGLMGLSGTNWNFANFFALPILIGAGHEYGVFLVHRYLEARKHPRRVWESWDSSDRALLLCAYVTSSSFGFFWLLASHAGLRSLGWVMAVGTVCIYLSAVMVLRPILKLRLDRFHRDLEMQSTIAGDAGNNLWKRI